MPFAGGLRESLEIREGQVPTEFTRGESLEQVLNRHLTAVEENFDGELISSILLLSPDGKRLSHGAAPNLPESYRDAIDGTEIGPRVGSCGTAAFCWGLRRGLPPCGWHPRSAPPHHHSTSTWSRPSCR